MGDWTEQLMSALTKLGCCLLDTHTLDFPCKALSAFVQEPTAAGLLDALAAAQAVAAVRQAEQQAAQHARGSRLAGWVEPNWHQLLQHLNPAERHHLRTYLLQAKWFSAAPAAAGSDSSKAGVGFSQQQLQVLRSLPIFELHPPLAYEDDCSASSSGGGGSSADGSSNGSSGGGSRSQLQNTGLLGLLQPASAAAGSAAGTGLHRSLPAPGSQQQLLLPPQGITSGAVLGSQFLRCESASEEVVLIQHLGIRRLPMQEFLMLHLAKAPQQLDPRALISTVAHILHSLKDLSAREPDLLLSIKGLAIIPTRAGSGAGEGAPPPQQEARQQLVLAAPCELFDPSNAALVQLLDPRHFPAAPFDGTLASHNSTGRAAGAGAVIGAAVAAAEAKALLAGLTLCGLRREIDLEVRSSTQRIRLCLMGGVGLTHVRLPACSVPAFIRRRCCRSSLLLLRMWRHCPWTTPQPHPVPSCCCSTWISGPGSTRSHPTRRPHSGSGCRRCLGAPCWLNPLKRASLGRTYTLSSSSSMTRRCLAQLKQTQQQMPASSRTSRSGRGAPRPRQWRQQKWHGWSAHRCGCWPHPSPVGSCGSCWAGVSRRCCGPSLHRCSWPSSGTSTLRAR